MKQDLYELIKHFDGKVYDLCYKIIDESDDLEKDFQYLCENLLELPQEKEVTIKTYISEEEYEFIRKIYDGRIEGILSEIINKVNYGILKQDQFYSELYQKLTQNFTNKKELAVAFERVVADTRIPFIYLGKPLSMKQKDYAEGIKRNEENIKKIIYILKTNYSQKTEEASMVLNLLESIEDYTDRVIVMAQIIDLLKRGGIAGILKDLITEKADKDED